MESPKTSPLGDLREALDEDRLDTARVICDSLHPSEVALILESLPPPERSAIWTLLDDAYERCGVKPT